MEITQGTIWPWYIFMLRIQTVLWICGLTSEFGDISGISNDGLLSIKNFNEG